MAKLSATPTREHGEETQILIKLSKDTNKETRGDKTPDAREFSDVGGRKLVASVESLQSSPSGNLLVNHLLIVSIC